MKITLRKIVLWFKGLKRLWVLTTVENNINSLVFQVKDLKIKHKSTEYYEDTGEKITPKSEIKKLEDTIIDIMIRLQKLEENK